MAENALPGGLDLEGISKTFGPREAVRSVSLQVHRGEVVTLIGPNGAGKSTLMRVAAGAARPDRGVVRIEGIDMAADPPGAKRRVGWVADRPMLYDELTPAENLAFFGRLYGLSASHARKRAADLLDRLGAAHRAADATGSLSAGMRQRVSLARALVHEPRVLLLDEPFEGLDPQGQAQFLEALRSPQARDGRAVLVITQNVDLGLQLADRIALMDRGSILKISPREAVSAESVVKEMRALGGEPPAR